MLAQAEEFGLGLRAAMGPQTRHISLQPRVLYHKGLGNCREVCPAPQFWRGAVWAGAFFPPGAEFPHLGEGATNTHTV